MIDKKENKMTRNEKIFVVGVTIFVCFCVLLAAQILYGAELNLAPKPYTFVTKEMSVTFPGKYTSKKGKVGSPYGDVLIEEAEYNTDGLWLHARHAAIPAQMLVEQTAKDIAIRMLAPLEEASKKGVSHMAIEKIRWPGIDADMFFTHFLKDGCRFFCGVFVMPGHAVALSTMDCQDAHVKEIKAFLGSVRIPKIDEAARGK